MNSARKWFQQSLVKRRHIDPVLLSLATAGILLPFNIGTIIFALFFGVGLYLIVLRPRSARPIDPVYAIATVVFAVGSISISIANGSLASDGRWASYPVYYLATLPLAAGVCLIRDPLRQIVIGARIGIAILAVWSVAALLLGHSRYGFTFNMANSAFVISFIAVISRIEVKTPPRFLNNHVAWFYLALFPILTTGTRAVLPVFLAATIIDVLGLVKNKTGYRAVNWRNQRKAIAALAVVILVAGGLLAPNIQQRVVSTFNEIKNIQAAPDPKNGGMSIRLAQWRAARAVISDNFWLGIGGTATREAIIEKSPPDYRAELSRYSFAHNAVLDEWMQRGIFGVVLTSGFFIFCFGYIYRKGTATMRNSVILLVVLTVTFGLLHYLLLVDRHVALFALYFLFMTTAIRNGRNRQPCKHAKQ